MVEASIAGILSEREKVDSIVREVKKIILGQDELIGKILIALFAGGHVLLEGVPGLAKTLLVSAIGKTIGGTFRRIQMVPDMMPSDIVGTYIYASGRFEAERGPVIGAHVVLVDEVNRAPAKTQAALLQAMQERQVTIMGKETFELQDPFMVLATQNPIEQEGTYPLPEAQLDRFLFKLLVDYPSREEEIQILENTHLDRRNQIEAVENVITPEDIVALREEIRRIVQVGRPAHAYMVDLCRATRHPADYGLGELGEKIRIGASPRGILALRDAARVYAFIKGRRHVYPEDIQAIAKEVLRHRILLEYTAEMEGIRADDVIQMILSGVSVP
ncbi:MAG: MoxR family ATPase [Candidatus Tectomicrobia bacterium]|uniref:MoxR family ATPase n=1 Tax=Tectimicrobiota bacterium TaxID=2528274 RepID=A0A932GS17_UNCTE|nr:MoxR family ATPase [Candidatus Tectomicrobia bacterium]